MSLVFFILGAVVASTIFMAIIHSALWLILSGICLFAVVCIAPEVKWGPK